MNMEKHSNESNSRHSPNKQPSPSLIKGFIPAMLMAIVIGTYLDLFFIGKGLYSFPMRPMADVFTINIVFTLVSLPLFTGVFLYVCSKMNGWQKAFLILTLSLFMSVFERIAESMGLFIHHESWKHMYSFIGYFLFFMFILCFYEWMGRGNVAQK